MIVGVPREIFPGERRVALVPAVLPNLAKAGMEVVVEAGAGAEAGYPDAEYAAKGAKIIPERSEVFRVSDIVVQVLGHGSNDRTGKADLPLFHQNQVLIAFLRPLGSVETIQDIANRGVTSFSVELMPRITRAQSMDALSAMATISRIQVRPDRCRHTAEDVSDAYHRGGHDHARPGSDPRRGRRRSAGHRHRAPPRRRRLRVRCAACREGASAEPGRALRGARHRSQRRAGRAWVCHPARRSVLPPPARAARKSHRRAAT